jgi:ribosomal protein S18 acetylase RimI-like enzyme
MEGGVAMLTISQVSTPSEIQGVQELMREYTTWVLTVTGENDQAPPFQGLEQELATLPGVYAPPTGCLLLALLDDQEAGCIALKGHDATTGEIRRLYVRPAFRGRRIGQQLVAALIAEARKIGYQRLFLDTHISMTKAQELYVAAGSRKIDTPSNYPEAFKPAAVFMELTMA